MRAAQIDDMTLDQLRTHLGGELAADAAFDGWNARALAATCVRTGVDPAVGALAFSDGPLAMIDAWFASIDAQMVAACTAEEMATLKIRERITRLVETRLTLIAPHIEALRRAQAILANPLNVTRAVQLGWRAADVMWRQAGDTATDYNHYTKRAILGSVYGATMLVFVNDESADHAETRAFLARRIEGIMRFEKTKARLTANSDMHFSPARFLGRLRYPAR
jgi:ubiquinone biosynthesis protein COQ9